MLRVFMVLILYASAVNCLRLRLAAPARVTSAATKLNPGPQTDVNSNSIASDHSRIEKISTGRLHSIQEDRRHELRQKQNAARLSEISIVVPCGCKIISSAIAGRVEHCNLCGMRIDSVYSLGTLPLWKFASLPINLPVNMLQVVGSPRLAGIHEYITTHLFSRGTGLSDLILSYTSGGSVRKFKIILDESASVSKDAENGISEPIVMYFPSRCSFTHLRRRLHVLGHSKRYALSFFYNESSDHGFFEERLALPGETMLHKFNSNDGYLHIRGTFLNEIEADKFPLEFPSYSCDRRPDMVSCGELKFLLKELNDGKNRLDYLEFDFCI